MEHGKFELPKDHSPFIKVPVGGSNCGNCRFLTSDGKHCGNKYFVQWYGTSLLPQPVSRFCSDWFEPNPKFMKAKGKIICKKKKS